VPSDFRYAWRLIRKSPGFSICVIALLGLGIGLNNTIFTLLNAILLRPLSVRKPAELVRLVQVSAPLGAHSNFTYNTYRALKEYARSFTAVFGYFEWNGAVRYSSGADPVRCQSVTGDFFTALGVTPLYGSVLMPGDELHTAEALPVVLSYAYWTRRFSGDPSVIGKQLILGERVFTIVGVTPRGFHGVQVETGPDLCVPLIAGEGIFHEPDFNSYSKLSYALAARLRPGVGMQRARAEAEAILQSAIREEFHSSADGSYWLAGEFQLQPLANGVSLLRPKFSLALRLLMSGSVSLMLIVSANVAGLLLARTAARSGEIAVRLAIGATSARLASQWLIEVLLLTVLGALAGLFISISAAPLIGHALPVLRDLDATALTLSLDLRPDLRLFSFCLLLCISAALLAGLPAALAVTRADTYSALKSSRATPRQRMRWILVSFQIGLCTLLLASAGLMVSTFRQLCSLDPGFDRDHIVTFSVAPEKLAYSREQSRDLTTRLMAAAKELPGVISVAVASRGLMRGTGLKGTMAPAGQSASTSEFMNTSLNWVSAAYFDTMGIHLLSGRNFRPDGEPKAKPEPVIVNQAFARHFFPAVNPIGQKFGYGWKHAAPPNNEIIGVVSDAKYRSLREAIQPTVYQNWEEGDDFILHVRTHGDPISAIAPVRQELRRIDARLPVEEVRTLAEEVDNSLWAERVLAYLATAFSVFSAVLAAFGIFSALAYAIAQSRREIGIRMALGAPPLDLFRLFAARPMRFAAAGVAGGVVVFEALAPFFRGVIYRISVSDPIPVACAVIATTSIALGAILIAATTALRLNPAVALREE
jgi:predicted permease